MRFDAYVPTRLVFGAGRLTEVGELARKFGRQALLVTSRTAMARLGYTRRVMESLDASGVRATVFHDLGPTPTSDNVDRAAETARAANTDLVIGLGGGSALDCAKAAASVAPQKLACADLLHGRARVLPNTLPIIAIPTTAGTGSETNRAAIITDPAARLKDAIRSDYLFPRVALVDPELTYDLPEEVTAQTGFDALAHAVESYVSPKAQPLADGLALEAIAAITDALPRALANSHDADARLRLALAATSMGYNLSCVGTCLPHRLDKPLCALFPRIAHGQAVAFFYQMWAEYSWRGCPARFARIASLLDSAIADWPADQAAAACGSRLAAFIAQVGLGRPFASHEPLLTEAMLTFIADRVTGDLQVNPLLVERKQLVDFFRRALGQP